jgi:hypothetical protein
MALDLSHVLIGAPYDTPLRVRRIVFDQMRARCAELGVFEGSSVRRIGGTNDRMLIEVPKSGRVWLDRPVCTCIEVEPISRRSDSPPR